MGAVKSSLVLNDGMSSALRRINNAMSLVINNFEAVQRASGKSMNTANMAAARREMALANHDLDQMEQNYRDCNNQQEELNNRITAGTSKAGGLLGKIKAMAGAYLGMKTVTGLTGLSDTLTSNAARLELIVDDGSSVDALQQKIYNSAQAARASYTDVMATVAKLGLVAGDAFSNNDQLVKFTELVNKNFVVGGASATEASSAMYQLTQALGSGRLQGDEYRSIIENAPLLAKSIEDYMRNVQGATGTMKDWASEGKLTADVIREAVFNSAGEVEERFNNMPMTWAQVWTSMKNRAVLALNPVLKKINELANNSKVQSIIDGLINGFALIANLALGVVDVLAWIADNWRVLLPILLGGLALAAFAWLTLTHTVERAGKKAKLTGFQMIKAGLQGFTAGLKAAGAWIAANWPLVALIGTIVLLTIFWDKLGTVGQIVGLAMITTFALIQLAALGVTWPFLILIGLVLALALAFVFFTEQIVGAIWWLGALFKNIGLWIANVAIGVWNTIKNVGLWFANLGLSIWAVIKNIGLWFANLGQSVWAIIKNTGLWFANLGLGVWNVMKAAASNIGTAFSNAWISIQVDFWTCVDALMQGLKSLAEKANECLGWMGVNIDTSGFDFASKKIDELNSKKEDYKSISDAWDEGFHTFEYDDVGAAWNTFEYDDVGAAWNTNEIDWAGGWSDGYNTFDVFQDGWGSDAYNAGAEVGAGIKGWLSDNLSLDSILGKMGVDTGAGSTDPLGYGGTLDDIAGDTSSLASNSDKSTEELAYLRDIAEREAINRFTTAEIKVDMTGMSNRIDSNMDIDGVISYLSDGLVDALSTAAEGVY